MRKHPRVCDLPGGIPVHWWLYLTRQYQDGLFGRDAGFDFHVLLQFQFDVASPQQWYSSEEPWSGITLDSDIRNVIRINLSGVMLLQIPESIGDLQSLVLLYMPNNKLVTLPESISELVSLTYMSISENPVSSTKDKQNEIIRRFARLRLYIDID